MLKKVRQVSNYFLTPVRLGHNRLLARAFCGYALGIAAVCFGVSVFILLTELFNQAYYIIYPEKNFSSKSSLDLVAMIIGFPLFLFVFSLLFGLIGFLYGFFCLVDAEKNQAKYYMIYLRAGIIGPISLLIIFSIITRNVAEEFVLQAIPFSISCCYFMIKYTDHQFLFPTRKKNLAKPNSVRL